jgi:hypothetical protein
MLKAINIARDFNDGVRNDLHVLNNITFSLDHA